MPASGTSGIETEHPIRVLELRPRYMALDHRRQPQPIKTDQYGAPGASEQLRSWF